jgi:hypothetical protein
MTAESDPPPPPPSKPDKDILVPEVREGERKSTHTTSED